MEDHGTSAGHRRPPALTGNLARLPPRTATSKQRGQYLADPPTVEEVIEVMRVAGDNHNGQRLRALIVVLWHAGLRISEALALQETDLHPLTGAHLRARGTMPASRGFPGSGSDVD